MVLEQEQPYSRLEVQHPGGCYSVFAGAGLLPRVRELAGVNGPIAVITNEVVGPLYAGQIPDAAVITISDGEQHKQLDTVRQIYDALLEAGLDRGGTVVALGGGVVGDTAGFAAATYLRGVRLVQCPTTLLAMVDSSVGGKTGVNLPQGKNLVGAFKQPVAVLADTATLQTLPPVEFAAGMAEVIKHGLIGDVGLLERVARSGEDRDRDREPPDASLSLSLLSISELILDAIRVKRDIVQADPFESGRRAVLNLGHTFGQAIEREMSYRLRHGEAVAMGLVAAAHLSARLGHARPELQARIERILASFGLPTRIPGALEPEAVLRAMGSDKKRAAGRLRFVLIRDVCDVFVTGDVPREAVLETLAELTA